LKYVSEAKKEVIEKFRESRRVLKIAEKPDREEFEMSAKVTAAGTVLIGLIGFIFYVIDALILPA
jgi:protein transport protein SEC61 subunit gamma-like protein